MMVVVVDGCTLGAGLVPAACGVATQLPQHRLYLPWLTIGADIGRYRMVITVCR